MARNGRQAPVGVGGWLLVLVVTLALAALVNAAAGYGVISLGRRVQTPEMRSYFVAVAGFCIVAGIFDACVAWLLLARQRPGTVRIVVAGLWLAVLLPLIGGYLGERLFFGSAYLQDDYYVVLNPKDFAPLGYAAIATAYLLRSKRVANTYAPRDHPLATVFR